MILSYSLKNTCGVCGASNHRMQVLICIILISLNTLCFSLFLALSGIPLTVHSARPSSRSSIRSTGSIGSYGNRRASSGGLAGGGRDGGGGGGGGGAGGGGVNSGGSGGGGGSKGILVSTSRTGAARSAAILLISCHITAVSKQNSRASSRHTSGAGCSQHSRDNLDDNNGSGSGVCGGGGGGGSGSGGGCRSCESTISMNRQLQRQLNHQRHLLSFELSPAKSKNQDRFRTLLGMNGIDNNYHDEHDRDNDHDFHDNDGYHSIDPLATGHQHPHQHNGSDSSGGAGAVPGGYYDSATYGYGAGAELHHLHIGALPTPASETPRFAVNQLSHQSSKSIKGHQSDITTHHQERYVPCFAVLLHMSSTIPSPSCCSASCYISTYSLEIS